MKDPLPSQLLVQTAVTIPPMASFMDSRTSMPCMLCMAIKVDLLSLSSLYADLVGLFVKPIVAFVSSCSTSVAADGTNRKTD